MVYFWAVILALILIILSGFSIFRLAKKAILRERNVAKKHLEMFHLMSRWVEIKHDDQVLLKYFSNKGIKKIAIYGASFIGSRLLTELKETPIEISYLIDNNPSHFYPEHKILTANDSLGEVDAVIVTAFTFFDEIKAGLKEKLNCPILSIEDIVYEIEGVHDGR
ncbi:MAG: hypothetical protein FWG91_06850 [Lachnospiraceae bacterium]|nr:hypothetical protein [Lachnospiraceae bacterium]